MCNQSLPKKEQYQSILNLVSQEVFDALQREADILKKIHSPYIVRYINSSEIDGTFYTIMEICDCDLNSLAHMYKLSSKAHLDLIQKIFLSYLSMLNYKIVHRYLFHDIET